jgi:adenylyl-sulfate kinase
MKTFSEKTPAENHAQRITPVERAMRHGHPSLVVWFTGLSGAGKTTLATLLERRLFEQGRQVYLLDGDLLRTGLCSDLDYSNTARVENIRRAGEVAHLLADAGFIALSAFISPFRADRDRARSLMPKGRFIEVFVNAPLAVCEQRDAKGLYLKARAKIIPEFTGINSPYEAPETPELELHTDREGTDTCLARLEASISTRLGLTGRSQAQKP